MAPQPAPISDLARMYRERIPTAPKSIGRLGPVQIGGGGNWFTNTARKIGGGFVDVVESLDPRVIASEGGRSVQHVVGDVTELGRSILTGEDTLSQSPTARTYQAAGGGAPGVLAAALPYVNVGTAVLPTTRVLTPAGRLAMSADVAERTGQALLNQGIATATPTVRRSTADAAERLAQSMASQEMGMATAPLPDRPTIYMNDFVYDPNPPNQPFTYSDIDNLLNELNEGRPQVTTQLPGVVEGATTTGLPRGVYAVDTPRGDVTIYQLTSDGTVGGRLTMRRGVDGFQVVSLSAPPGSTSVANLLAAAKITADLNFPGIQYPLTPSRNLSQYSRPLVEKLKAAGLIDPEFTLPESRLINTIDAPFDLELGVPIQDVPRLSGIPQEQLQQTTRNLIRALAQAKREGRISPDTIETTAKLRADLAQRQAEQRNLSGLAGQGGYQLSYEPRPEEFNPLLDYTVISVLGDAGPQLISELRNSPDQTTQALLSVANAGEMILMPIQQFENNPMGIGDYVDSLVNGLRQRLGRSPLHRQIYGNLEPDEEMFVDELIYSTLWKMWDKYGGPNARPLIDSMPTPEDV